MNPNAVAVGATNAAGVVVEGNVPPPGVAVGAPGVVDTVESLATAVETLQVTGAPHVGALPVGHGMDAQAWEPYPGCREAKCRTEWYQACCLKGHRTAP